MNNFNTHPPFTKTFSPFSRSVKSSPLLPGTPPAAAVAAVFVLLLVLLFVLLVFEVGKVPGGQSLDLVSR
jgi:hypothetical protein